MHLLICCCWTVAVALPLSLTLPSASTSALCCSVLHALVSAAAGVAVLLGCCCCCCVTAPVRTGAEGELKNFKKIEELAAGVNRGGAVVDGDDDARPYKYTGIKTPAFSACEPPWAIPRHGHSSAPFWDGIDTRNDGISDILVGG